jgi:hypothetical protein
MQKTNALHAHASQSNWKIAIFWKKKCDSKVRKVFSSTHQTDIVS